MRRLWLPPDDPPRPGESLGPAVQAVLLGTGDRLATHSTLLAQRYWRHAAAAWAAFGAAGFARWVGLAEELATHEPACREAAAAYLAVEPAALRDLDAAAEWCALAHGLAAISRRLAATFLERTAAVLARPDALPRLRAFAAASGALAAEPGWRAGFLAQAFLEAAPAAVLGLAPEHYRPWGDLGRVLARTVGEREFFATLPAALERLDPGDRGAVLGVAATLAAGSPAAAWAVWQELPAAVADLPPPERRATLALLARLPARDAAAVAGLAPVLGVIVRAVPAEHRLRALAHVDALAARAPDAAVPALRVLARLYEEARPAEVAHWFETGAGIVAESPAAGVAYFALESRTSWSVLHAASTAAHLEESRGVWRKVIQMMSGQPATVRGFEGGTLRPPLAAAADAEEVALPFQVSWLGTAEDNAAVYAFVAAQVAARRTCGTYAVRLDGGEEAELVEDLFLLAEAVRIHHCLARTYRGLAAGTPALLGRLLGRWAAVTAPPRALVLDALLALVIAPEGARPPWLAAELVDAVRRLLVPLAAPGAVAADSLRVARALAAVLGVAEPMSEADVAAFLGIVDYAGEGDDPPAAGAPPPDGAAEPPPDAALQIPVDAAAGDDRGGGRPLSLEELRRLIEGGARLTQGEGEGDGPGLPITDLAGKLPPAELARLRQLLAGAEGGRPRLPDVRPAGAAYYYDEWDHRIGDYRARWCRLHEVLLPGDSGEFFSRTLLDYATLVPDIRRQFQRIRPEQYRIVRGLEDGEDFDLNAVIEARIDLRARRSPSTRLYRARVREARDVATLFLLDMSASTDEPLGPAADARPGRRIIDAIKEALVVMTEALDELGDAYAICGFSGQGRHGVEFYPVKGFAERLGPVVKARIGGIEPRRSTRMGTALRHAVRKIAPLGSRAKHLILLSDGFPQDHDYGDDRRSHVYGIRDTAVALREADAAGITPFCITVDRAGHDYLREMCAADRYLVIDDVEALPRELPKIYRRVVA